MDEQIGREQTSAGRTQQHGVKMGECLSILAREGSRAPENGAQGTSLQPAIDAVSRRCQRVLTPKAMHVNTARIPVGTYSHLQGRIDSPQEVRFEGAGRIRMSGLARRGRGSTWSKPTKGAERGSSSMCLVHGPCTVDPRALRTKAPQGDRTPAAKCQDRKAWGRAFGNRGWEQGGGTGA